MDTVLSAGLGDKFRRNEPFNSTWPGHQRSSSAHLNRTRIFGCLHSSNFCCMVFLPPHLNANSCCRRLRWWPCWRTVLEHRVGRGKWEGCRPSTSALLSLGGRRMCLKAWARQLWKRAPRRRVGKGRYHMTCVTHVRHHPSWCVLHAGPSGYMLRPSLPCDKEDAGGAKCRGFESKL